MITDAHPSTAFDGMVVIVTGAGRGMGRSHAMLLADRGARVVVNDHGGSMHGEGSDSGPADDVVAEIRSAGGASIANTEDVSTPGGCAALVEAAVGEYGRLDAIIHNAGVFTFTPLAELDDATWSRVRGVSLDGGFFLTRAAWPHFVANGGGAMLYITSGAGFYGVPTLAHYGAAKAGLLGLARVAAHEGAPVGIRCNALGVGAYTRMTSYMLDGSPEFQEFWKRQYRADLVSAAAAWLIHPDCPANGRFYQAMGSRVARVDYVESRGLHKLDLSIDDVREHFSELDTFDDLGTNKVFEDPEAFSDYVLAAHIEMGAQPPRPAGQT